MANLFERIGLIQENEITLNLPASEFQKVLNYNLDPPGFRFFEVFAKSHNSYKGSIDKNSFNIQKKRRLFQLRSGLLKISGKYNDVNDKTVVSYEVSGWNLHMIILYLIFILFYAFGYSIIFQGRSNFADDTRIYFAIALTLHMALQISAPILAKKRTVKRTSKNLKYEFEEMIANYRYNSKFELG